MNISFLGSTRNREPFAPDPKPIDLVPLTQARIDHGGLLPKRTGAAYRRPRHAAAAPVFAEKPRARRGRDVTAPAPGMRAQSRGQASKERA